MKIVFFSPNGQPNGPRKRIYNYSKRLQERGHNVTIFTKQHFHGTDFKYKPLNKPFDVEYIDGIKTVWIDTIIYKSNGIKRLLSELQFILKSIFYILKLDLDFNVLIADSVTPLNALAGLFISKIKKRKFIYQIRDVWPIAMVNDGSVRMNGVFYLFFRPMEKLIYKQSDWICSALPFVAEHVKSSGGDPSKITYIRNGADLSVYDRYPDYKSKASNFTAIYMGTLSYAHDVITIVKAAYLLLQLNISSVTFHIYGEGVKKQECIDFVKENSITNVYFYNMIPKNDVPKVLSKSDLLLAPVLDSKAYDFGINLNKLYDYMAIGRPIIFSGNAPNDDVLDAGAGYSIEPERPDILRDTILNFISLSNYERELMAQNAKAYAKQNYDANQLVEIYEEMLVKVINN